MIHNIRLGHACNSSSTHSIVPAANLTARDPLNGPGQYGWDWFVLLDEAEKMRYLAVLLAGQLDPMEINRITGHTPSTDWDSDRYEYIDHQSSITMPSRNRELFVQDFAAFLRRPEVAVLGGNDNEDRPEHLPDSLDLPLGYERAAPLARPDLTPEGERFWTLYYPESGSKVRFTFDPVKRGERTGIPFGGLPELVDLKLTAYCPFEKDCPWCYMDSTTKGAHATKAAVGRVLTACKEAGVFEIAIGGGEPTMWPHLDWLTKEAEKAGVTLNMTTKNFTWLKAKANRETLGRMGAIAVSVNNAKDLDRFGKLWDAHGPDGTVSQILTPRRYSWREEEGPVVEVTIQCIPALLDDTLVKALVEYASERRIRLTFLGLKRTGRAEANTEAEDLRWIGALEGRDRYWLQSGVAVDTIMAAQARPTFEAADVDPVFYGVEEGAFSCYIDAVAGQLGPSSYAPGEQMLPLKGDDDLGTVFRHAQVQAGLRAA